MTDQAETKAQKELRIFKEIQASPLLFVRMMWDLTPQKVKPERATELEMLCLATGEAWEVAKEAIKADWFLPFEKGKNITWQQWLIMFCIEKGLKGEGSTKISIASGHGCGKSSTISMIILWYLFSFKNSQVPCTAPTADQIYDVLWKEISLWISRMPDGVKDQYEWAKDHIRMKQSPETWFARAKTASKENTEALAGVHADHVLTIADEASGVPEQVYNTAEGAWTSGNILVLLISNPTRTNGYFYDTHHKLKKHWQNLRFSSIDSPIVDRDYEAKIAERHGRDSAEYGIRVLGQFPRDDSMDDSGYVALLTEPDIHQSPDFGDALSFKSNAILGVDPAGDGDDKTSWYIRDNIKGRKLAEESVSTAKSIAEKTLTFIERFNLDPANVIVDAFGAGMDVGKEIAIASKGRMNVTTVNVGDKCDDEQDDAQFLNKRAMIFWRLKQWFRSGGEIVENKNTKDELLGIRFKRNLQGRIQIMPKVDMKKKYGLKSPNDADALALTFIKEIPKQALEEQKKAHDLLDSVGFDPHAVIGFG